MRKISLVGKARVLHQFQDIWLGGSTRFGRFMMPVKYKAGAMLPISLRDALTRSSVPCINMQSTYAYPLVPVANFLSAFLVLIPLPWLLQHWNTGAWTHAIWSSLLCFITGVNTTLWSDNVDIKAVVWCDISE